MLIQCLPPRPEMTIASPRCLAKILSMSAVLNIAIPYFAPKPWYSSPTSIATGRLFFCRFLERDVDARRVGVVLDEVVVDVERVQEALGVGRRGVGRDAVARPAAQAHHQHDRHFHAQEPAADRIAGLHEAGVLDEHDRLRAAGVEARRDRHRGAFARHRDERDRRLRFHQRVEPVRLAVGQPHDVRHAVLLHLVEHRLRAQVRRAG